MSSSGWMDIPDSAAVFEVNFNNLQLCFNYDYKLALLQALLKWNFRLYHIQLLNDQSPHLCRVAISTPLGELMTLFIIIFGMVIKGPNGC